MEVEAKRRRKRREEGREEGREERKEEEHREQAEPSPKGEETNMMEVMCT